MESSEQQSSTISESLKSTWKRFSPPSHTAVTDSAVESSKQLLPEDASISTPLTTTFGKLAVSAAFDMKHSEQLAIHDQAGLQSLPISADSVLGDIARFGTVPQWDELSEPANSTTSL